LRESPQERPAIFLHGGWRSASTYVWSRFRALPETACFFEPFDERLARCTPKRIGRDTAGSWDSRHPLLGAPYRQEYLPLLRIGGRGVRGYREQLALARYFPSDQGVGPETRYLSRLFRHARADGKQVVLGLCRSLARSAALRNSMGGYHIVVRRRPLQQWLSFRSYRQRLPLKYFELCQFLILALAPAGSPAGCFARHMRLPRLPRLALGLRSQLQALHAALHPWSDELSYRAFTAVSLLSHSAAESAADLTLDVDRLGSSPAYRDAVSARIRADSGLALDFSDCTVPRHEAAAVAIDFGAVEEEVRECLAGFGAELGAPYLPSDPRVEGAALESSPRLYAPCVTPISDTGSPDSV
jgi:hypothetical protein